MNIRSAQARDLEAILALDPSFETDYVWQMESSHQGNANATSFRVTRLPRTMRVVCPTETEPLLDHFERGECFLVAEEEGAIRGFIDATEEPWKQLVWVNQLTVAPDRRRRGIGSALLQGALNWAHRQGASTVMAGAQTKNHPAASLFQKHGFTFCGFNDRYYSTRDIAIFFALSLR